MLRRQKAAQTAIFLNVKKVQGSDLPFCIFLNGNSPCSEEKERGEIWLEEGLEEDAENTDLSTGGF